MSRFFICNREEIDSKIKSLTKTGASNDGWSHFYKVNGEQWVLTQYHSEYHGGGISVLKRLPLPNIDELIDIALTAMNKDDIRGASFELSENERKHGEDFRQQLIQKLSVIDVKKLSDFEMERLKVIIYETEIHDATNRRNIVGKHLTEIQRDAEYFQHISKKAKEILNELKKYSSS